MTYLLGLDLGTSGVKALLLPVDGPSVNGYSATVPLSLDTPRPGWSEQRPEDWWRATVHAIRAILHESCVDRTEIAGVAISGQMHGATLLDGEGLPVRPCILWNDQRSAPQCDAITNQVGLDQFLKWVGNPALAGFTAPKLLWMREHEPELWGRVQTVLLPKDYLTFRLTGNLVTELSDASGTLLLDVARRRWSAEMLKALDLSDSLLPELHASTDIVGKVTAEAASATGLPLGTPVVAGGADNACAAVGMGVVRPGDVLASLGTSGTLLAPTTQPQADPVGRLHLFCHVVPDSWYVMGVVLSAGGSLRWFRDSLAEPEVQRAIAEGRDPYEVIVEECLRVPAGSDGLIFLPYLTGERTPHADPHARGVFFGLSVLHTRAHLARSVIEGVTYALTDSADLIRQLGIQVERVHVTGGGSSSTLWRQILADVLEAQVVTAATDAGPSLGAALIAGVGVGVFPSLPEATDRVIALGAETEPEPSMVEMYRRYRAIYTTLYPALQKQFKALDGMVSKGT